MNLTRYNTTGRVLFALTVAALLSAGGSPRAANAAGTSDQKIGDICARTLSYDVTGPYYASCRNYLRSHSRTEFTPVNDPSEPAGHRACQEIGLAKGTAEYKSCVQELSLLDISAAHL